MNYLVTKVETDQSITGRNISTNRLYTSTDSTNWLLDRDIATVGTLQKGKSQIPHELFDTQNKEILVKLIILKGRRGTFFLASYTVKTKSKGKKNVMVLSTYRSLHGKTIDDGKEKPQILKFYDFTKGGTDIVDHLNDCYTTR